jgi:hypothetical protein
MLYMDSPGKPIIISEILYDGHTTDVSLQILLINYSSGLAQLV